LFRENYQAFHWLQNTRQISGDENRGIVDCEGMENDIPNDRLKRIEIRLTINFYLNLQHYLFTQCCADYYGIQNPAC
jgi:hypothetical protein